jgi:uncharacterized protein
MSAIKNRKTALITGASSGLGAEFARIFAQDGYNLVLVARTETALCHLADELNQKHGIEVKVLVKDLNQPNAPQEIFDELQSAGITLDILVNNAGFATYSKFAESNLADQLEMMQVNMLALVHLTRLFLPGLIERRSGKIMNVASTAAFQPGPLMAVYYATKAFVLSFSEALANELAGTGVTVTAFCPGPTQTGFQKRAAMEDSKLFSSRLKIMDAATAARSGYEGMLKGKTIVIPGLVNSLMSQGYRYTPRKLMTKIVRNMQERASH